MVLLAIFASNSPWWEASPVDLGTVLQFEDFNSIGLLVSSVVLISAATFCYIILARCLNIRRNNIRVVATTLTYYWSVEILLFTVLMIVVLIYKTMTILSFAFILALLLIALLIWFPGAQMLVRASPWNKVGGWKRLGLQSALTSVLIIIFLGLFWLTERFSNYSLKETVVKTVDIVDGECNVDSNNLKISAFVHNSSPDFLKIKTIKVLVEADDMPDRKFHKWYSVPVADGPKYLKADDTDNITVNIPADEFLNQMISNNRVLNCSYALNVEYPSGNFNKDQVRLLAPK
jgi:hypothetical protein